MLTLSVREESLLSNLHAVLPQFRGMAILTASLVEENDVSTHAHDIAFWDTERLVHLLVKGAFFIYLLIIIIIRHEKIPINIVNMTESTLAYQQFVPSST